LYSAIKSEDAEALTFHRISPREIIEIGAWRKEGKC